MHVNMWWQRALPQHQRWGRADTVSLASQAKWMSCGLKESVSKDKADELSRKTPNRNLCPPTCTCVHISHTCMYACARTHTHTHTHTHIHTHTHHTRWVHRREEANRQKRQIIVTPLLTTFNYIMTSNANIEYIFPNLVLTSCLYDVV